jgi:tagatose 6-phosphate kinase
MILTVTLNPALDVTYRVDAVVPGTTHRVREVEICPGGKGVNVARVLGALGARARATGLIGGSTGQQIVAALTDSDVQASFVPIAAESRRTVVVVDSTAATGFWEAGPTVSDAEWRAFRSTYTDLLSASSVVVLSGSLPPGVPDDAYAQLTTMARAAGAKVVVDADGVALQAAVRAGPEVVKPNRTELSLATGHDVSNPYDAVKAARLLRRCLNTAVVATLDADGMVASTVDGEWRAKLPERVVGNPTGAGDACAAALALGLLQARPWAELIVDAVAYSAAAAATTTAGTIDPDRARGLRASVVVEEI